MSERYFSSDYRTARSRFRESVDRAGGGLESLQLTSRGPAGEDLTIDIGWFGSDAPRSVLLHSSGLHGVEAFAGSAIQLRLIEGLPALADDMAIVLVHVLNPYGMAWLRRFNENNVDLNRNFLKEDELYEGRPEGYDDLYSFLNPTRLPGIDMFVLRAAWLILRYGRSRGAAAVVVGQYDYPEGLFFGGHELQEGPRLYQDFLIRRMSSVERVFGIDVHTGLGRYGEDTVLVSESEYNRLHPLLGDRVQAFSNEAGNVAYKIRGGLHEIVPQLSSTVKADVVGQEFGTYGQIRVLNALRKENFSHHHRAMSVDDPLKLKLRDAFYPDEPRWREKVLRRGEELFRQVLSALEKKS